jgi:hypothetical protein
VLHVVSRRWRGWMVLPVIGAAFLGGGVAGVEAAGGVINACVNNSSGTIHIVAAGTSCGSNEMPLAWNTQGPPGPPGTPGNTGPQGPAGTALASTVLNPGGRQIELNESGVVVATLNLPAGSYSLLGRVDIGPIFGNTGYFARCSLTAGPVDTDEAIVSASSPSMGEAQQPLPSANAVMSLLHTFANPGTAQIICQSAPPPSVPTFAFNARLTAVQVTHIQ